MTRCKQQLWLASAAVLAIASSGFGQVQQDPQQNAPKRQEPVAQQTPEEIAARRRAYEARQESAQDKNARQDVASALREQEQKHRLRLGRIERLKALLRENGDTAKLKKLEEKAEKENTRYHNFVAAQRRKLGPEESAKADRELERGRARAREQQGEAREAAAQRERRAERERREQREREKNPMPGRNRRVPTKGGNQ